MSADGSLKLALSAAGADGAGEGVVGASDVVVLEAGAGAAGAKGVCAVAGAGVVGAFEVDDEAAGAALGFDNVSVYVVVLGVWCFTFEIMQTMKPFSSILYDSTVLASCNILPVHDAHI